MQGNEHSKTQKSHTPLVVGVAAAILVVAGSVGIPFDLLAAAVIGAALVLIVD